MGWVVAAGTGGPVGSVVYSVLLDERGGIRSDITVARMAEDRFVIGANGPRDVAWLRRHAPTDGSVAVVLVTSLRACAAVWGPLAREILQPIADADLSSEVFPYLSCREMIVGSVPVDAVRISYAGELGWELTATAANGAALWDAIWAAGRPHGLIAAGRAALGTLRIEKGYRAWGTDMTTEHAPVDAGLGFTVRRDGSDFLGRAGLATREPGARRLRCLVLEDEQVAMGGEPVFAGNEPVGYVTSAGWGASVGESLAYAWVPRELQPGASVDLRYFDRVLPARIAGEPRFDPGGERLRV
jgi:glycine cleavage system aminomethyltransferase T